MKFWFYYFSIFIVRPLFYALFSPKCSGRENMPLDGESLIVYGNHTSIIDPIMISIYLKSRHIRFMGKKELFDLKWFSPIAYSYGAFPVDRNSRDIKAVKLALQILKGKGTLGIFPEGTRQVEGEVGEAKAGIAMFAYKTHTKCLPVKILNRKRRFWFPQITLIVGKVVPLEEMEFNEKGNNFSEVANKLFVMLHELV